MMHYYFFDENDILEEVKMFVDHIVETGVTIGMFR